MRHVFTLFRRELGAYFLSPMAYLILIAFQVIAWINFWQLAESLRAAQRMFSGLSNPMNSYISGSTPFWIAMLVAVPALTMRLIAEEKRTGTIETLLTVPITETEVVVSKWMAGLVMYLVLLLPYVIYLPFLYWTGKYSYDLGPIYSLGIGLTTMGMMFVAIGVFFSALTRNQIVAAVGTFASLFLIILLTLLAYQDAVMRQTGWGPALQFLSVIAQTHSFGSGQLDLRFLAVHLSATVFMLFATVKLLEERKGK
ncbi:MAG TPA: ABC transporter permease subunit [Isosphaeraceae bacterium]|jgi:ABC-2 type transport system permease protein|nr:ABC transporter permease subunit [Isosphaeraceae bacterium]